MNMKIFLTNLLIALVSTSFVADAFSQRRRAVLQTTPEVIKTNIEAAGLQITLTAIAGKEHNHPMMAAWMEGESGRFLQTLYVNESVAKGYFNYADPSQGKWKPGALIRPASLPVWAHKRGIRNARGNFMPTQQNPVPDAFTSATPKGDFILKSSTSEKLTGKITIFFEVNQSWDWNDYWTNNKFPDDDDYKTSAQPSVIYKVEIDLDNLQPTYFLQPVGHGHPSGRDGAINPDLSTITTALQIFESVTVEIAQK
jgi:hypothetical protein